MIMAKPIIINATIAITLTIENQNSLSPNPFTVMALIRKITIRNRALQ